MKNQKFLDNRSIFNQKKYSEEEVIYIFIPTYMLRTSRTNPSFQ